ncbi:toll/interleukin-1 receptor domain-containing protein [Lentzea sp. NPDC054927]
MLVDVFISYSRRDVQDARQIANLLIEAQYDVWIDWELLPGQTWKGMIREKIEKCDRFVCIVTPEMLLSQWCLWELSVATRMCKPVVPVLVRAGGQEHAVLRAIQFADFTGGPTEVAVSSLLKGVLVAAPTVPDPGLPVEAPESELLQPYYRRHFSDAIIRQQFDLRGTGEEILEKRSASRLVFGFVQVGGRLTLTDLRLLFEAHAFNFKAERIEISLADVQSVATFTVGVLPPGFTVHTRSGRKYRFVLYGRDRYLELIEQYRP